MAKQSFFIKINNFSDVFGGQEKYVHNLINELEARKVIFLFVGKPESMLPASKNKPAISSNEIKVQLLNGNRALYLRGWSNSDEDIRVYVQHSHVQDAQGHPLKQWVRKILLRLLLMRMDIVIRVCNDALPDKYAPGKIHTIYNGVSIPDLPANTLTPRPFTLLMVGAVNENKNQKLALQALEQELGVHLLIVGDGPDRSTLELWSRSHGVESRVRWTGFVDDPSPFYLQADALLMLSAYEAFPYAVLEAMAHALPVVSTRVGGVPEAITHEHDGLLLPSRDLASLVDAVQRLRESPSWRAQLGQRARQTVLERFTLTTMTDKLLDVISQVARQKGLIT